jgi:DNA invertase Pin-like site-specific DNA recombinase
MYSVVGNSRGREPHPRPVHRTVVCEAPWAPFSAMRGVSTSDQDVAGQTMQLTEAGAIEILGDVRSSWTMERPGPEALLAYAREGDTLAVARLDRLGRSLDELLTTVAMLEERGIALLSLEERIETNSAAGELVFHVFGAIRISSGA